MIELPEAITLARQMTNDLRGRRIESAMRGNSPHKFAFYNRPPEEYAALLPGKTIGEAWAAGGAIMVAAEPGYTIELGGGGERIRLHADESTVPPKHQFLLRFCDGTCLSMTIQMWGSARLLDQEELSAVEAQVRQKVVPTGDAFTHAYFQGLFRGLPEGCPWSVKFLLISQPGVWGLGNGYTNDILYRAHLHPRRRALQTTEAERTALYEATRQTLLQAVELGGRDTETDLYGKPGGYVPLLDRRAKGTACPKCGATIEAISFLGGTSYLCPGCQT